MEAKTADGASLTLKWRAHCQQQPQRFVSIRGTPAMRKRVERWEQQLVAQLTDGALPLAARAAAFRAVIELRGCTARDAGDFFGADPQVIVMGLSLLEMPAEPERQVSVPVSRKATPRTKAA